MKNFVKIILAIAIGIAFVGCGSEEDNLRLKALEKVNSDSTKVDDLGGFIEASDYKFYQDGSDGEKYSYSKNSGDKVKLNYVEDETYESMFVFTKDYDKEKNQTNFILTRTTEESKYIYSIYTEKTNTILVEREVYKDCSVDKCDTKGKAEITYEHYLYDVEKDELKPKNENINNIDLKDVKGDIDIYFEELIAVYDVK